MWRSAALLACAAFVVGVVAGAHAQKSQAQGNAEAGRALALTACTGCHVVLPDQPFPPLITGPPDFHRVANRTDTTAAALRRWFSSLPTIPPPGKMANPDLTNEQVDDIIAFIMTLRDQR